MTDASNILTVKLKSSVTLANINEFHEELHNNKNSQASKLVLDCALNEEIDFAAIQTLTSFYRHMESKGMKVVWDNPSIALFQKTVELGMDEALGL